MVLWYLFRYFSRHPEDVLPAQAMDAAAMITLALRGAVLTMIWTAFVIAIGMTSRYIKNKEIKWKK